MMKFVANNALDQKKADALNTIMEQPFEGEDFYWLLKALWVFVETRRRGIEWFLYGKDRDA